ncbi:4-hydroxy-tetrahydrodipicolinate reductase [Agromyces seonyuensis]|uniref:4-hydroxy-tetrahydrodipicolinate reductase n=1 Tax=Agromyces seonyuensis TaxID=2662446 RepID=UPI003014742B
MIRVAVTGASGRMGRLVVRLVEEADDLELHAALGSADPLERMLGADVLVDVTVAHSSAEIVPFAVDAGIPVVVGTSGWSRSRIAGIRQQVERRLAADERAAVRFVPNFSLGSVLGTAFARLAAPYFPSIEILEAHHAGKVDSPSGTAVRTAELIGEARSELGPVAAPHADQRARGQLVAGVPVHSMRLSGLLAKQDVVLGGDGETLTITHTTFSDASYEAGILLAVRSTVDAAGVAVGLDDLLGLPGSE